MLRGQKRPGFPKLGKEFLVQRLLQIADAFRTAAAGFGADHALDHLAVVRAPQRKIFVVIQERFGELIFLV